VALRRPPLEGSYRWLKVLPLYRSPQRFSEDPREWVHFAGEPRSREGILRGWRSLRKAQHEAVGTVIYSRQAFRLAEPGARKSWSNVVPVCYRASLNEPWVADWSALARAEDWRSNREEPDWEHELNPDQQSFLEVMRVVHGQRRRHDRNFGNWARRFLPGPHWAATQVDEAWVRACPLQDNNNGRYEVSIGRWPQAELLGRTDDFREAVATAERGLGTARKALSEALAETGGLAAELAVCPDRWPEPRIHVVPAVYDTSVIERLREHYERLLEQRDETDEDADGN